MKELTISDECPTIGDRFHLTDGEAYRSNRALVVSFTGHYRDGSRGNPDAAYMRAIIRLRCDLWWQKGLVIDLSALRYDFGDMIESAFDHPRDLPVAIVVSPLAGRALATLWYGEDTDRPATQQNDVFDNLPDAISFVQSQ
ncbi:hypothetical protein VDQ74_05465 [Xanthomonas campestris pv. campestris]|nr:hypothetical protein [Xanthomonas campestris pv. campestris]